MRDIDRLLLKGWKLVWREDIASRKPGDNTFLTAWKTLFGELPHDWSNISEHWYNDSFNFTETVFIVSGKLVCFSHTIGDSIWERSQ